MKTKIHIGILALMTVVLLAATSCKKVEKYTNSPLVGHWGCEEYVSHRVDTANGVDRWDTSYFNVGQATAMRFISMPMVRDGCC